jgi:hypothetical protein
MGPLKRIAATVASVKGDIKLKLLNQKDAFSLEITSPANTLATVGIPHSSTGKIRSIQANEVSVWSNGKPAGTVPGLTFLENNAHYITFAVKPGEWNFKAKKSARNDGVQERP